MGSDEGLSKAYSFLEQGDISQAKRVLTDVLEYDLDNQEVSFALWCCSFWAGYIRILPNMDVFERGEALLTQWKAFLQALTRQKPVDRTLFALQKGIFSLALESFTSLINEQFPMKQAELRCKIALCYKKLGKYETALETLKDRNILAEQSAQILAEMADCYALCGEEKKAKVLFREAFFIDAQKVDLALLDSELICCLIRQVQKKGYTGAALQEWIPVYGVLYGIFNVKRELRSHEVGQLKQDIYARENELRDPACNASTLTPKLINVYFWLIDHYVRTENSGEKINEILLRIKILDRNIYDLYVK
ncbi:MAG: tetratricopeptide repeat protein [Treponema sp.]|nr:tetratricopeptide repeat protein [Treponema sp.]